MFISQDKYVHEILRKFNYTDVKSASTPTDLEKPLGKDADADDVDEHWNGYLRKGRKTKPKRQNRTRNGKAWKRQSPSLKKSTKVNPDKSKVKK
ncbi:hypothetical protein Tco_0748757 [Tanacetum coccineum]|uniref:Uncharacterized protein n=1 Tax=Tanacetum coccineum TaxID=301880 RepID=A0ABQ4YZ13_9ASTR